MLKIGAIVWGVRDIPRAVAFWSAALDYVLRYPPNEDFAILVPRNGDGLQLSFNRVTSSKPRKHHMDLHSDDPEAEVARLIALGPRSPNGVMKKTRIMWSCMTLTTTPFA